MPNFGIAAKPIAYKPPFRNPPVRRLPKATRELLKRGTEYSAFFVAMAERRSAYMAKHRFWLAIDCCMDERVARDIAWLFGETQSFNERLVIPPGIIPVYATPGVNTSFRSRATGDLESKRAHVLSHWGKLELRLSLAHMSSSRSDSASCAALNHDWRAGLERVRQLSGKINYLWPGARIGIHGMEDTDDGTVSVFGPNGHLDTRDFSADMPSLDGKIRECLEKLFPKEWGPLAALKSDADRDSFYGEFAELLANNVRRVANRRVVLRLAHTARMFVVGRNIEGHVVDGEAFCLSDDSPDFNQGVLIGAQYSALNNINDAKGRRGWEIPAHVIIPHSSDDRREKWLYAVETRERIIEAVTKRQDRIVKFLLGSHGVANEYREAVERETSGDLARKLVVSVSVSDRSTRALELAF